MNSSSLWTPLCTAPNLRLAHRMHHTRSLARTDPDLFVELCFRDPAGRVIEQSPIHHELQAFLTAHPKALVELPRDHGKSFQVCCRVLWELGRNPSLRVKMVCATEAVADERSRFLRSAVARNPWVAQVFPDLKPAEPWAADAFTVARPADVIGPSVAAFGVGAHSTGTRADLLVCDDVVDVGALHSKAAREKTATFFHDNLMNLLEPDGRFWGLCTPWHPDDLNARLKKSGAYAVFRRAVGPELEPVWPERWPPGQLAVRRAEIGSSSFARGYHLQPVCEDETVIRPAWVRAWTEPAAHDFVVLSVDPAVTAGPRADASGLVVLGRVGFDSPEVRVLAASARRVATPELVELIDAYDRAWNPDVILFESNAAFAGLRDLLQARERFGSRVRGVAQRVPKDARVAAFSVAVENGRFRLKGDGTGGFDPAQRPLLAEMTAFPFGEHDDLLDAAATGTAYLLNRSEPRAWT